MIDIDLASLILGFWLGADFIIFVWMAYAKGKESANKEELKP